MWGYQVELMPGLTVQFLLWLGDEEFPPSGQILFSDNFRFAFTAEDMANIGDIILNRMKPSGRVSRAGDGDSGGAGKSFGKSL